MKLYRSNGVIVHYFMFYILKRAVRLHIFLVLMHECYQQVFTALCLALLCPTALTDVCFNTKQSISNTCRVAETAVIPSKNKPV